MELNSNKGLEILKEIYDIDQLLKGNEYIRELVKRLGNLLNVKYVMVGHTIEPHRDRVQTDCVYSDGFFAENVSYDLKDTPCSQLLCGKRVRCYKSHVQQAFPEDTMLGDMGIESYLGAPFIYGENNLMGILVILDDKPLQNVELYTSIVEFFAARIGTEYRRMQVEESLLKINEDLEKIVEERSRQLVSQEKLATIGRITLGIAHELKNPLNIIINSAQLLQEDDLDKETRLKATEMIYQHGLRANSIITNMLRQARYENTTDPEWTDISHLLDHTLDVYLRSITDFELKDKLKVSKNIPPGFYSHIVDPPSLERVIINIIDNSIYALKKKSLEAGHHFTPSLKFEVQLNAKDLNLHITDNGVGIPNKHISNVINEFYTTKPPGEGTGLGLWIAKQNIEKNHGRLHIESEENKFTKVKISLPGEWRA